jgi:glycosyltransferase involved in cell wall biosynthesis
MSLKKIKNYVPEFSIILPTYNRPQILKRAVKSIFNQSFQDFEVIIINDGSILDYNETYKDILTLYPNSKIQIIHNSINLGAALSRNLGIKSAKGKFISFLDDDDEYLPTFLELTYNILANTTSSIGFSWSGVKYIFYDKNESKPVTEKIRVFFKEYTNKLVLYEELFSIGIGHGFTIKADSINMVGGFSNQFKTVEDTDLFFRLIQANYDPVIIPEVSVVVHNHILPRMTGIEMHEIRIKECQILLERYDEFLSLYPILRNHFLAHINNLQKEIINS